MLAVKEAKNVPRFFGSIQIFISCSRGLIPKFVSTLKEVGLAMINSVIYGYEKPVLEVKDLIELAEK